jgi:RNA polymerase sigma-70 factor (ECF subfamily)
MEETKDPPDRSLIDAYLAGNPESFTQLYERYRRPLYSYLNNMVPGQPAVADDLFQKTWMKVIKRLPNYQDRNSFAGWLYRIAHNTAIDFFRKQKRESTDDIDDHQISSNRGIPWQRLDRSELGKAISQAVDELPSDQREVFVLRQQNVAFKEIAEIQGCSINTVLGRMHYATQKLRSILRDWH